MANGEKNEEFYEPIGESKFPSEGVPVDGSLGMSNDDLDGDGIVTEEEFNTRQAMQKNAGPKQFKSETDTNTSLPEISADPSLLLKSDEQMFLDKTGPYKETSDASSLELDDKVFAPNSSVSRSAMIAGLKPEDLNIKNIEYSPETIGDDEINKYMSMPLNLEGSLGTVFGDERRSKSYETMTEDLNKKYNLDGFGFEYNTGGTGPGGLFADTIEDDGTEVSRTKHQLVITAPNGAIFGSDLHKDYFGIGEVYDGSLYEFKKSAKYWDKVNSFIQRNKFSAEEQIVFRNKTFEIDKKIEDFFDNDDRFKTIQNYSYFLPETKGGSGTPTQQKDRRQLSFNYDDQLKRLKDELGIQGHALEYYFDTKYNKIAKRYADRHLTDYTKDVQKKDEEQFGDNIELKVFNLKEQYRKLNYTEAEKKLSEINSEIETLQEKMSSPTYSFTSGSDILTTMGGNNVEEDKNLLADLITKQKSLRIQIGNGDTFHGHFLNPEEMTLITADGKDNSVEPIFDLDGNFGKEVVDLKNQTHINNKDILKAVNSISANLDSEFMAPADVKTVLTEYTDDIAARLAISDQKGETLIPIKGFMLQDRGFLKLEELGYDVDKALGFMPSSADTKDKVEKIRDQNLNKVINVKLKDLAKYKDIIFNPSERTLFERIGFGVSEGETTKQGIIMADRLRSWISGEDVRDSMYPQLQTDKLNPQELYMMIDQYTKNRKADLTEFKVLMAMTDLNINPSTYNKKFGENFKDALYLGYKYVRDDWSPEAAGKSGLSLKTDHDVKLQLMYDTYDFKRNLKTTDKSGMFNFNENYLGSMKMSTAFKYGVKMPLEFTEDLAEFAIVGHPASKVLNGIRGYRLIKDGKALSSKAKKAFMTKHGLTSLNSTRARKIIANSGYTIQKDGLRTLAFYGAGMGIEEGKMKYAFEEDYKMGGGSVFFLFGGAMGRLNMGKGMSKYFGYAPKESVRKGVVGKIERGFGAALDSRRLNTVLGVPYAGGTFALASGLAVPAEAWIKDLKGYETFKKQAEDLYPTLMKTGSFSDQFLTEENLGNVIFGGVLNIKGLAKSVGSSIKYRDGRLQMGPNVFTSTAKLENFLQNGNSAIVELGIKLSELKELNDKGYLIDKIYNERANEINQEITNTAQLMAAANKQLIMSQGDVFDEGNPDAVAKHLKRVHKDFFNNPNVEVIIQQGSKGFKEKGLNENDPAGIFFNSKTGKVVVGVNTLTVSRGMFEHELFHYQLEKQLKNDPKLVGRLVNAISDVFSNRTFYINEKDEETGREIVDKSGNIKRKRVSYREYIEDLYYDKKLTKKEQKELNDIEFLTTAVEFLVDPINYSNILKQNNGGELTTWTKLKDVLSREADVTSDLFIDKKSVVLAFARISQELSRGGISSTSQKFLNDLARNEGKFAGSEFDWLRTETQFNDVKLNEMAETKNYFSAKEKDFIALGGEKNPEIIKDLINKGMTAEDAYKKAPYTMTRADWTNPLRPGSQKAFDALYAPKESNIFRGIILKGIEGNNVYGRSKDAFVERVQSELARDVMNFNPEMNNNFSGYLANRIFLAKGDILNDFAKNPFEKSRDVEVGELGSVRERGAEDVGIKTFEDTYVFGENKKNIDKSKKETGLVQTEKGLIEPLQAISKNKTVNEKIENQIQADKPADLSGKNIANLEPSKELVDLVKPLFGKNRKDQIQNMIDNGELYYKAYFPESAMYGEGVLQPGKSSTMISKAFPMFYVPKGERAIKATEIETGKAGTKSGLEIRDRMPWSEAKTVWENMSWSDLKIADLKSIDAAYRNQGTALNSFFNQAAKVINNRGVRKLESNEKLVQQLADGKGEYMAAKLKDGLNDIRSPFGKTYESSLQAINLYQRNPSDFRKRFPNEWKIINNLANNLGFGLKNVENATGFVEAVKQFKLNSSAAKKFGITNEEFQAVVGEVSFLQRRYNGKDYNLINVEAATIYSKNVAELQAYLSSKFGETFSRSLLGDHYRTNMGGITDAKAKQKYGEYVDGSIVKFDKAPEFSKVYDKSKQVDKGGFFNNISEVTFKQINSLKNSYDKANKLVEQGKIKEANEVLDKAFSVLDNNARKEIYNAWQKSKEAWLNSSTSKQQWLERAKHILLMGRNNTHVVEGERQLAEVVAVYRGDVVGITKLEHAKPMVKQSVDAALAVINGEWSTKGEQIMKDFKGIIGPKSLFNIIDLVGKTTNPSGMARMVFDFESLKDYQVVGTEKSLYDVLSERSLARVGKDLRKEGLLHLKDQLVQLALRGEQADVIIAENAIKNSDKYKRVHNKNANTLENMGFSSKGKTNMEIIEKLSNIDKAIELAKNPNKVEKGISVFDFDDTVGKTKSKVIYTMPDGIKRKISAAEFATKSTELEAKGAKFDFSEFDNVVDGTPGPFINKLRKAVNKFGNENVFILTARPQQAAIPIQKFLQSLGVNLKIENITGLADGRPEAKAQFIVDKAAQGYNDFYFVDDAYKNVQAVQKVLNVIDVKSDVQQAYSAKTKDLNKEINSIIEYATGIGKEKVYSAAKAAVSGQGKKNWSIYMPNRAGDFYSLTNALLGKGKKGLENREWFKENLSKPFSRGDLAYQTALRVKMNDYRALRYQLKQTGEKYFGLFKKSPLKEKVTKDSPWTNEHAVRVYNWNKQGILLEDISKSDVKNLVNHVNNNPRLKAFAGELVKINKGDGYPAPREFWVNETITQDMIIGGAKVSRQKYMKEFIDNANIIFSTENLNKMEAALGKNWRTNMEDALERMKTGTNRPSWARGNKWEADMLDFMNGSISGIMFLNMRSAILQQVSMTNYMNITDNNPFKAAKTFANISQFSKDYVKLMNDQWSLNRRDGLRYNIQESEIVEALSTSTNKPMAIINWALKKGFVLTKYADSHATAFGGASFYRNRFNTYKKKGLSKKEAEERALEDWREASDATQQTSRMDRVSQEQKSIAGRLILPFTSVQLAYGRRYIDDPGRDLLNGRYEGLIKGENSALKKVGQIVYGTVLQGAIFHGLQQGIFKVLFEDGDTLDGEELEAANATLDGILVGMGIRGKFLATFKNWLIKANKELKKDNPKLRDTASELLKVAPPIDKKYRQIRGALATLDYEMDEINEFSLQNPALEAVAATIEATTNAPTDRLLRKMQNVEAALEEDRANWQRPFLLGGWSEYDFKEDDKSTNTFRGFEPRTLNQRGLNKRTLKKRKLN